MSQTPRRAYWLGAGFFAIVFVVMLGLRLDLFDRFAPGPQPPKSPRPAASPADRETWLSIFQNGHKIGYSHKVLEHRPDQQNIRETMRLRLSLMGQERSVRMATTGHLNPDWTLRAFSFQLASGQFDLSVQGQISGRKLRLKTQTGGRSDDLVVPLSEPPYFSAGLLPAVQEARLAPGQSLTWPVFDPTVMATVPVTITVAEQTTLDQGGRSVAATRLTLDFKGTRQQIWLSREGQVLQESGLMGLKLVKTTRAKALSSPESGSAADFSQLAAISVARPLPHPRKLTRLRINLTGAGKIGGQLDGGRQQFQKPILTIHQESVQDLPARLSGPSAAKWQRFLAPSLFIQSDDEKIQGLAQRLTAGQQTLLAKARELVFWTFENIDKRPVVSLPDARATLRNRAGDCNEHAVLLAALARAAGLPARVETGLVYLEGRFFYHAWNRLYLGRWITADAALGQLPADATHIRLTTGPQQQPLSLLPLLGRLKIEVLDYQPQ